MSVLVRAPDHLGDGVMALPAITAIAEAHEGVQIAGPAWARDLYGHLPVGFSPTKNEARIVLLKPSLGAAWRARHHAERIGLSGRRRLLLTHPVPPPAGHRQDGYAAVVAAMGLEVSGEPTLPAPRAAEIPEDTVLLMPGTRSARTARWQGFRELATELGPRALFVLGPGDRTACGDIIQGFSTIDVDIPRFVGLAVAAHTLVGNDSGLSHLAAAARRGAGLDTASIHVMYASTDPRRTGPRDTTPHFGRQPPCWPCYRKRCVLITAPCRNAPAPEPR